MAVLSSAELKPVSQTGQPPHNSATARKTMIPWRGVHVLINNDRQITTLEEQLPRLAAVGVNALILEVDYNFDFQSHPELVSHGAVKACTAHHFAASARQLGIRLIPELNCLGHQSWSKTTAALLLKHPEFDETPGQYPNNEKIYCRSWCPQNPEVNKVIFALIDELADAFEADAFHVGMDEVFIIGSDFCPRCSGQDPAKLFARTVNDLHQHIVGQRKLQMLMWGDRLLDSQAMHGGEWEYANNGTHGAAELIPKDIVICDWHYGKQTNYPSVTFLLEKGFRVWPSSWQPLTAAQAFSNFCRTQNNPRLVGFLCTVWGKERVENLADWPPIVEVLANWKGAETGWQKPPPPESTPQPLFVSSQDGYRR
jgi:Glycosyl hydrolase family 20, catalytic domain